MDMCRLCLKSDANDDIFQNNGYLSIRIVSCCRLQPEIDDGLPTVICESCQNVLDRICSFQALCHESDRQLRAHLGSNLTSVIEVPIKIETGHSEYEIEHLQIDTFNVGTDDIDIEDVKIEQESPESEEAKKSKEMPLRLNNQTNLNIKRDLPSKYECDYCHKVIGNKSGITTHIMFKHLRKRLCRICKGSFSIYELAEHLRSHRNIINRQRKYKYECKICNEKFQSKYKCALHSKTAHSNAEECTVCGKRVPFSRMSRHLEYHTVKCRRTAWKYDCAICFKIFLKPLTLMLHLHSKHPDRDEPTVCTICERTIANADTLDHLLNHDEHLKPCVTCNMKFFKSAELNKHLLTHGVDAPTGVKFSCNRCGKLYNSVKILKGHIRVSHTIPLRNQCHICSRFLSNTFALKNHMRLHTGEKNFECDVCGKKFIKKTSLQDHVVHHFDYRPYACESCGQSFNTKAALTLHVRLHVDEKAHHCTICGKGFTQISSMKRHTRNSHKQIE